MWDEINNMRKQRKEQSKYEWLCHKEKTNKKLQNKADKSIISFLKWFLNISLPLIISPRFITLTLTGRCNSCVFMIVYRYIIIVEMQ